MPKKLNLPLSRLTAVFALQMYSKSLTERRNTALKYRADIKKQDPSIQGYVKFPATLMIKCVGGKKAALKKSFELQLF